MVRHHSCLGGSHGGHQDQLFCETIRMYESFEEFEMFVCLGSICPAKSEEVADLDRLGGTSAEPYKRCHWVGTGLDHMNSFRRVVIMTR